MAGWLMPFAQNIGTQVATGYALDYLTPKPVQPGQVNRQGPPPLQTQGTGNMVPAQYRGPILHEAAYVDPFAAGYFDNGGLVGWDPDADQGINRGVGDAYDYTAGRENTSPFEEATKEVAKQVEQGQGDNSDMYGRPWGHPDYGKAPGGSAPYDEGTYNNLKQGAALAGGAALLGAPVAAMAGPLALPLAAMHLWKNRDRVKDDFSKFGKSFKDNFSKEGRESFYDRQDADVNRQNAGWGDYYTDEHGNTKQKHATWRDFTRAMSGETNWGGQPQGVHALPENQAASLPADNSNDNSGGYHEEAQGGNYDSGLGDWGSSQDSAQFINRGGKVNCGPMAYKNEGGNIMPPDTVVDGKFFSSHAPKFKERVGPLAKTVHKDKDGASWERHYHDPDKPKGGDNAQTKEGNGAGSVRK